MLARRGWSDITLVEQQSDPTYSDPDRSYVYCIDGRGRKFLDPAGLTPALQEASVATSSINVNRVGPDGRLKVANVSVKDASRVTHWLPRGALMKLLVKALEDDPDARKAVRVAAATRVARLSKASDGRIGVSLEPVADETLFMASSVPSAAISASTTTAGAVVTCLETPQVLPDTRQQEVVYPRVLLACDGHRSIVRDTLEEWHPGQYRSITFPSLSTGLRFKVLGLPPNPVTKAGDVLDNASIAVLQGRPCKRLAGGNPLRLGLLPIRDPQAPRTGNVILLPDHPFWDITDGEQMYQVFEESFPQMDWRALVPPEAMARFAASRGGTFPAPQYTSSLSLTPEPLESSAAARPAGGTSVMLVGDAAHSFPPDLGQGVNSTLEDIVALDAALAEAHDEPGAAARLYQERRLAEAEALAKLMQVGWPLQYRQYKLKFRVFTLLFAVQLLLSKVLPWLVRPPIAMLIQDPAYSYTDIWAGAQRSAAIMPALAGAAAVCLIVASRLLSGGVPA